MQYRHAFWQTLQHLITFKCCFIPESTSQRGSCQGSSYDVIGEPCDIYLLFVPSHTFALDCSKMREGCSHVTQKNMLNGPEHRESCR
jgi:hypothetical protein